MSHMSHNSVPCQWMYFLEDDCNGRDSIRKILLSSAIAYGILSIKDIGLLLWKGYLRYKGIEKQKAWTSLEYVLAWASVFCILRSFDNFMVVYDLFPDEIILRVSLFAISWIPGFIATYVYITGIFRAIPRLSFNRLTHDTSKNSLWLLNSKRVKPTMWVLSLITTVGVLLSSIMAGYFYQQNEHEKMIIAVTIQTTLLLLGCVICWVSLFYYGRVLVSLTREGLSLTGVDDESNNKRLNDLMKQEKRKIEISIRRMQTINYAFGGTYFLFSLFLIPVTIWYKVTMLQLYIVNLLYCLVCNIFSASMVTLVGIVVIYLEIISNNRCTERFSTCSTWMQSGNNSHENRDYIHSPSPHGFNE